MERNGGKRALKKYYELFVAYIYDLIDASRQYVPAAVAATKVQTDTHPPAIYRFKMIVKVSYIHIIHSNISEYYYYDFFYFALLLVVVIPPHFPLEPKSIKLNDRSINLSWGRFSFGTVTAACRFNFTIYSSSSSSSTSSCCMCVCVFVCRCPAVL